MFLLSISKITFLLASDRFIDFFKFCHHFLQLFSYIITTRLIEIVISCKFTKIFKILKLKLFLLCFRLLIKPFKKTDECLDILSLSALRVMIFN